MSRKRLYSFHKKTSGDSILSSEGQVEEPAGPILSQVSKLSHGGLCGWDKAKSCQYSGHTMGQAMHIPPLCIGQIFSCVRAGRAQMVKEQSRLEKLLLQQQRELRTLQRTYEITKAGMHVSSPSRHPAINVNVLLGLASFPGLPTVCKWSKNWTVGRPRNEASLVPHLHKLWTIK